MSGASYYVVRSTNADGFEPVGPLEKTWLITEGYYRRFGDDCDPVAAFAAFFEAVNTDEYASIHFLS